MIKDIKAGAGGSMVPGFYSDGAQVYFRASSVEEGREWWRSDGTTAGTTMLKDIAPGTSNGA